MQVFLGIVFPYLAGLTFVAGMVWRTWSWLRRPVPFSITLDLPEDRRHGSKVAVAREVLLLGSLWRGDRQLWLAAWLMHVSLAAIVVGHIVGIAALKEQFAWFGVSPATSVRLSALLGMTCGLIFLLALLTLLVRRVRVPEVRFLSSVTDYCELLLLLSIALTGLWLRLSSQAADLAATRVYLAGLVTLRPALPPTGAALIMHFTLVNVLLVYFPFSKLVHLTGTLVARSLLAQPAPVYPTPLPRGVVKDRVAERTPCAIAEGPGRGSDGASLAGGERL